MNKRPGYEKYLDSISSESFKYEVKDAVTLEYKFKYKSLNEMISKIKEQELTNKVYESFIRGLHRNNVDYDEIDKIKSNLKTYLIPSGVVKDVVVFLNRNGKNVVPDNYMTGWKNEKTWKKDDFFLIYGNGDKVWLGTIKNDSPSNLLKKWISSYGSQQLKELERQLEIKRTYVAGNSKGEYGFDKNQELFHKSLETPKSKNEIYNKSREYELEQRTSKYVSAISLVESDKSIDVNKLRNTFYSKKDCLDSLFYLINSNLISIIKFSIETSSRSPEDSIEVFEKIKNKYSSSKLEVSKKAFWFKI